MFFCKQAQVNVSLEDLCFAASNIFEPLDGSIQLLQLLRQSGFRLGLLSNTCDCHWQFCRDDARFKFLHSSFEQTVLSFVTGHVKPGAAIYRIAASRAACDPGSILFIDDIQENVKAAQAFGFDGIQFQGATGLHNELIKRETLQ